MTWIRSTLLVAVAVGASGACTAKPKADGPAAVRVYPVADFYEGSSYLGGSFNADKSRILVSSDLSGVYNAYAVPTDGGDPQPLTTSTTDAIFAVGYFPNDGA